MISKDASITHQSERGWFIYLVNTCASLITPRITLKEFHLHQSHDCSMENDFPLLFFYSLARTGLKAGYRSVPLMSPLSFRCRFKLIKFLAGGCCIGWLTGNIIKRDLPHVVILLTAQKSCRWGESCTGLKAGQSAKLFFFSDAGRHTCQVASMQKKKKSLLREFSKGSIPVFVCILFAYISYGNGNIG